MCQVFESRMKLCDVFDTQFFEPFGVKVLLQHSMHIKKHIKARMSFYGIQYFDASSSY